MSLGFPLFFVMIAFLFIIPQFNIPVDTNNLGLMMASLFLLPFILTFTSLRRIIINPNIEEAELFTTDLIKMFASKRTLIFIGLWTAIASAVIIYEMYTGDKGITIGKAYYSADKILITIIVFMLFLALDETRAVYLKSMKRSKKTPPPKKKKSAQ